MGRVKKHPSVFFTIPFYLFSKWKNMGGLKWLNSPATFMDPLWLTHPLIFGQGKDILHFLPNF